MEKEKTTTQGHTK